MATLSSDDKFLVNDGSKTETVTWGDIQGGSSPLSLTITLSSNSPKVSTPLTATGNPSGGAGPYTYTYQWYKADDDAGANAILIAGATSQSYSPKSSEISDHLGCFVEVTDNNGTKANATKYTTNAVVTDVVIKKPVVLTPPDGAGLGSERTYNPTSDAIATGGVSEVEDKSDLVNLVKPVSASWENGNRSAVFDGNTGTQYGLDGSNSGAGGSFYIDLKQIQAFRDGSNAGKNLIVYWGSQTSGSTQQIQLEYTDGTGQHATSDGTANGKSVITIKPGALSLLRIRDHNNSPYIATITKIELGEAGQTSGVVMTGDYISQEYTELTLDSNTVTASDDNSNVGVLDEFFKAGDTVKSKGASSVVTNDKFATKVYEGDGEARKEIINNKDIGGTGGLIWIKAFESTGSHNLTDTLRGENALLYTDGVAKSDSGSGRVIDFNDDGFSLGNSSYVNQNNIDFVSWTFLKDPDFFDIVQYPGTGAAKTISHSLNKAPGAILCKRTDTNEDWIVYHKSTGATSGTGFSNAATYTSIPGYWNSTLPTDSVFSVGDHHRVNNGATGAQYIAYLFADDPTKGIKCDSYLGSGSDGKKITLGFKPSWVLIKATVTGSTDWQLFSKDSIGNSGRALHPNNDSSGTTWGNQFEFNEDGFTVGYNDNRLNKLDEPYLYIAIAEEAVATGKLLEDADNTTKKMKLTNVVGQWSATQKVVRDNPITTAGPGTDVVFTSSAPDTDSGTVTTWGNAKWTVADNEALTTNPLTTEIALVAGQNQTVPANTLSLQANKEYYVGVTYSVTDPSGVSNVASDVNRFKVSGPSFPDPDSQNSNMVGINGRSTTGNVGYTADRLFVCVQKTSGGVAALWENDKEAFDLFEDSGCSLSGSNAYSVAVQGNNVLVSGRGVSANRSTDGGVTWLGVDDLGTWGSGHFNDSAINDDASVWLMVGASGRTNTSIDNGATFTTNTHSNINTTIECGDYLNGTWYLCTANKIFDGTDPLTTNNFTVWKDYSSNAGGRTATFKRIEKKNNKLIACATNIPIVINPDRSVDILTDSPNGGYYNAVDYDPVTERYVFAGDANPARYVTCSKDFDDWQISDNMSFTAPIIDVAAFNGVVYFFGTGTQFTYVTKTQDFALFYSENDSMALKSSEVISRYGIDPLDPSNSDLRYLGIFPLTEQPTYHVAGYVKEGDKYAPIRDYSPEYEDAQERLSEFKSTLEARISALES